MLGMSSSEAVLTKKERFWKCSLLRAKSAKSFASPDVELSRPPRMPNQGGEELGSQ